MDLPPDLYARVLDHMQEESVDSASTYVRIALENQLSLEAGELGIESGAEVLQGVPRPEPEADQPSDSEQVWDAFSRNPGGWESIHAREVRNGANQPLWGQYNRLLPVKAVLRLLANYTAREGRYPRLEEFRGLAADTASRVKPLLSELDDKLSLPRGERLATGFPDRPEKSRERFSTQFVGRVKRSGDAVGAPSDLGFVTISGDDAPRISVTEAGLGFASLPSPIFDEQNKGPGSLSGAEREFYLEHVETWVPAEFDFMIEVLSFIDSGDRDPSGLTEAVNARHPDWSHKMANTMRGGCLGRLHELGLIERIREGSTVTYQLTPAGLGILSARSVER